MPGGIDYGLRWLMAGKADVSAMPTPATSAPPGVNDTGGLGNTPGRFAMENHTHPGKARKQRVLGVGTATYTWTYPNPFGAGVVPICNCIAEDPANSASDSFNVQVVGAPSATQATFRIVRQTSGLFGLILGAIGFNPTPATVNLHLMALEP
jgi:hypothetical protein